MPEDLRDGRQTAALQRENQILGVQLELLQANFLELFILGEVGLLKQFFQPLSVAAMFGVQAINLFAQRGILVLRPSSTSGSAVRLAFDGRRFS